MTPFSKLRSKNKNRIEAHKIDESILNWSLILAMVLEIGSLDSQVVSQVQVVSPPAFGQMPWFWALNKVISYFSIEIKLLKYAWVRVSSWKREGGRRATYEDLSIWESVVLFIQLMKYKLGTYNNLIFFTNKWNSTCINIMDSLIFLFNFFRIFWCSYPGLVLVSESNEAEVSAMLVGCRQLKSLGGQNANIEEDSFFAIQWELGKLSYLGDLRTR